jgi:hypothetical protein
LFFIENFILSIISPGKLYAATAVHVLGEFAGAVYQSTKNMYGYAETRMEKGLRAAV